MKYRRKSTFDFIIPGTQSGKDRLITLAGSNKFLDFSSAAEL